MGFLEIVGLVALKQVATAVKNLCYVGEASTSNPIGKEAWKQGGQLATQIAAAADYGIPDAAQEFTALQDYQETVQTDEKDYAAWIQTLPPIAP